VTWIFPITFLGLSVDDDRDGDHTVLSEHLTITEHDVPDIADPEPVDKDIARVRFFSDEMREALVFFGTSRTPTVVHHKDILLGISQPIGNLGRFLDEVVVGIHWYDIRRFDLADEFLQSPRWCRDHRRGSP
jgi:hypothetical protein